MDDIIVHEPNKEEHDNRLEAVLNQPQHTNVTPNYDKCHPLKGLLSKKNAWIWGTPQQRALKTVKEKLSSAPALAISDTAYENTLPADASSYGLDADPKNKRTANRSRWCLHLALLLQLNADTRKFKRRP